MTQSQRLQLFAGIGILFVCHCIYIGALVLMGLIPPFVAFYTRLFFGGDAYLAALAPFAYGLAFMGLVQLLYVVPLYGWFKRKGNHAKAKGIAIAAVTTMLINGICAAVLFQPF